MNEYSIIYSDVAVNADKQFTPAITSAEDFSSDIEDIQKDTITINYKNPIEPYTTLLDGTGTILPDNNDDIENLGIWSDVICEDDGYFEKSIELVLSSEEKITTCGITLTFDNDSDIYPDIVNVYWYRENKLLSEKRFTPNSGKYFFNQYVIGFDRVVFKFVKMNVGNNRLKLCNVTYGKVEELSSSLITAISSADKISPISTELPIGSLSFTCVLDQNVNYTFAQLQPIKLFINQKLKGTYYLNTSSRQSKKTYTLNCYNSISLLEDIDFVGGLYDNVYVSDICDEISLAANVKINIDECFKDVTATGYIPYTTCRDAIMLVAFCIGGCVFVERNGEIWIRQLKEEIQQSIPASKCYSGQKTTVSSPVTSVILSTYSYMLGNSRDTIFKTKNASEDNTLVEFDSPYYSLEIENGEILDSGVNYAIIHAYDNCTLTGIAYNQIETKHVKSNPNVSSDTALNEVNIKNCTLSSSIMVDNILNKCYNYAVTNTELSAKVMQGKHRVTNMTTYGSTAYGACKYNTSRTILKDDDEINIGDIIELPTEYSNGKELFCGRIIEEKITYGATALSKELILKQWD